MKKQMLKTQTNTNIINILRYISLDIMRYQLTSVLTSQWKESKRGRFKGTLRNLSAESGKGWKVERDRDRARKRREIDIHI